MGKFTLPKDGGLIEEGLPNGVKHTFEHIPVHIFDDETCAAERLADKIADAIRSCERVFRLGFSTGTSLTAVFRSLVRKHKDEGLSLKNVEIYSTDSDSFCFGIVIVAY